MSGDDVLIADGHHRYGVARIYRDEVRDAASRTDDDADRAELTLAFVGELVAEQLSVEAIHRLYAGVEPADAAAKRSAEHFDIEPIAAPDAAHPRRDGGRGVSRSRRSRHGATG